MDKKAYQLGVSHDTVVKMLQDLGFIPAGLTRDIRDGGHKEVGKILDVTKVPTTEYMQRMDLPYASESTWNHKIKAVSVDLKYASEGKNPNILSVMYFENKEPQYTNIDSPLTSSTDAKSNAMSPETLYTGLTGPEAADKRYEEEALSGTALGLKEQLQEILNKADSLTSLAETYKLQEQKTKDIREEEVLESHIPATERSLEQAREDIENPPMYPTNTLDASWFGRIVHVGPDKKPGIVVRFSGPGKVDVLLDENNNFRVFQEYSSIGVAFKEIKNRLHTYSLKDADLDISEDFLPQAQDWMVRYQAAKEEAERKEERAKGPRTWTGRPRL